MANFGIPSHGILKELAGDVTVARNPSEREPVKQLVQRPRRTGKLLCKDVTKLRRQLHRRTREFRMKRPDQTAVLLHGIDECAHVVVIYVVPLFELAWQSTASWIGHDVAYRTDGAFCAARRRSANRHGKRVWCTHCAQKRG